MIKTSYTYKLRRILPILGIAGASMFISCGKKGAHAPAQDSTTYNMVYTLDMPGWNKLDTVQIAAFADAGHIAHIIFNVNPNTNWNGFNLKSVSDVVKKMFEKAKGKGVAQGTFSGAYNIPINVQYADTLRSFGYKVELDNQYQR